MFAKQINDYAKAYLKAGSIITLLLLSSMLLGFSMSNKEMLPRYKVLKESDISHCYFYMYSQYPYTRTTITPPLKAELSPLEKRAIIKMLSSSDEYTLPIRNDKKLSKDYFVLKLKTGVDIKIFLSDSAVVLGEALVMDGSKRYLIYNNDFNDLFGSLFKKYRGMNKNNRIEKPGDFNSKNFLDEFYKMGYKKWIKYSASEDEKYILTIYIKLAEDESISIFEYKNNDDMELDSLGISEDGSVFNKRVMEWISVPHFYKNGRIIVLYLGRNQDIKKDLDSIMGSPIAGEI